MRPHDFRLAWIAFAALWLAACTSSIDNMNAAPDPLSPTDLTQAKPKAEPVATPLPKDAKVLTPGSRVNDYVNENLPSQFAHTVQRLNQAPKDDQYPAIEDIPQSEVPLLTLEERRKLEEELRQLDGS